MGRGLLNSEIQELDLEAVARTWTLVMWSRGLYITARLLFGLFLLADGFALLYVMGDDMAGLAVGLGSVAVLLVAVISLIRTLIMAARNPAMQQMCGMARSLNDAADMAFLPFLPWGFLLTLVAAVDALRDPSKVTESVEFHRFLGEHGEPQAGDARKALWHAIPHFFGAALAAAAFMGILKIG